VLVRWSIEPVARRLMKPLERANRLCERTLGTDIAMMVIENSKDPPMGVCTRRLFQLADGSLLCC
jgi:hypothetical protein